MSEQRRRGGPLRRTTETREQREPRPDYVQVLMSPNHFAAYREWLASHNLMAGGLPFDDSEFPTYIVNQPTTTQECR